MKSFLKFLLVFAIILLLSAILAPLLFKILPFKFNRIFNRLVMIFSIVAAFLFVRIGPETFRRYGLGWQQDSLKLFLKGFLLGVVTLIFLVGIEIAGGAAAWAPKPFDLGLYAGTLAKALLTGIVVGLIEEFFFRGFVYSWIKDRWKWPIVFNIGLVSVFYSLVHFVSRKRPFIGPDPQFKDSLLLMSAPLMSFMAWQEIWPHALGLFLFGIVLAVLVIRTGSLYPSIGLHAGCVFFVKSDTLFVDFLGRNSFIWSGSVMVDGLVSWGVLLLLCPVSLLIFQKRGTH